MATRGICSVLNCGKPHFGLTFCCAHYARFRKYGDPLGRASKKQPKTLAFLEGLLGTEIQDCIVWPYSRYSNGYGHIGSRTMGVHRDMTAHRTMCKMAHGLPPAPEYTAAHSCGKGHLGCVNPNHLSWKTATANAWDKDMHGTMLRGEKIVGSKLTADDVRVIRSSPLRAVDLAAGFGLSVSNVYLVRNRRTWRHI
jgi:hypothetical protein